MADNKENIQKLLSLFNTDKLLTKEDVDSVIAALAKILANNKSQIDLTAAELRQMVESTVERVLSEHESNIERITKGNEDSRRQTNQEVQARLGLTLSDVKRIAEEVRSKTPKDGKDGTDGKDGKDGSPDTAEQVRDKLESLEGDNRLDAKYIKNLPQSTVTNVSGGGGHRMRVYSYDLTSQCDGNNKTFKVPLNFGILGVWSTQAPLVYRPVIDFTEGNHELTLTSEVSAPETGQTLWCQYIR